MTDIEFKRKRVKQCPFCGADPEIFYGRWSQIVIRCPNCRSTAPYHKKSPGRCEVAVAYDVKFENDCRIYAESLFTALNEAISMWNERSRV